MDHLAEHQAALATVLAQVSAWQSNGAWQALMDLAELGVALQKSQTPAMAQRLGDFVSDVGQITAQLSNPEVRQLLEQIAESGSTFTEAVQQLTQWQEDGTMRTLTEMTGLIGAVRKSLTPPMVERVGNLVAQLGTMADAATDPGMTAVLAQLSVHQVAVSQLLDALGQWSQDGTWNILVETIGMLRSLRDSMNPSMVQRVSNILSQATRLLDAAMDSGVPQAAERLNEQAALALAEARRDPSKVTLTSLYRALRDPEVQLGIKTVMALVKRVPTILGNLADS